MNIKKLTVPVFVALSLVFTGCATGGNQIEAPDAVDGAIQDGIEGIEQGASEAGDAIEGGLENLQEGAEDATNAVEDGAKGLQKGAGDAAGKIKEGVNQGVEETEKAVKELGDKLPHGEGQ